MITILIINKTVTDMTSRNWNVTADAEIITRQAEAGQSFAINKSDTASAAAVYYDCSIVAVYLISALTTTTPSLHVNGWTDAKEAVRCCRVREHRLPGDGSQRFADDITAGCGECQPPAVAAVSSPAAAAAAAACLAGDDDCCFLLSDVTWITRTF